MAAGLSADKIEEIKREAAQIVGDSGGKLKQLYDRYEEIYFMTASDKPKGNNIDPNDWKVTISPSGRNAVIGMKRLLDTSEIHIRITTPDGDKAAESDNIEAGLKRILDISGMMRRARIEKDLNLSAILYGPAVIAAESVDDLIAVQTNAAHKKTLEQLKARTPFLLRAISPRESYSRWGEIGMNAHLRKYQLSGVAIEERWGVTDIARAQKYWVNDWLDLENRVAWIEGRADTLIAKPHGMPGPNIVARFAAGSSLFDEADQQHQSFLYAHTKGEWDKRENLWWTYLFTALYTQGLPGPLLIVDPESTNGQTELQVDFTGGIRKIFGKATATNFPVIDGDVLQLKQMMDEIHADSTIYKQTLGQNIAGSTFSGLAMLSSAGQLPLEDPKEAISYAFRDIFDHILQRTISEGIEHPLFKQSDIPEGYDIEVTLEPKLPQDNLRNAQVAHQLGDLVSDEWKRSEMLQIGDNEAMTKQVMKEQMLKGMIGAMMQDPNIMQDLIYRALNKQPPQVGGPAPGQPAGAPPQEMMPPPGDEQAMMEQAMMQQQGQPNMEQVPMTDAMPMPGQIPGGSNGQLA